MGKKGLIIGLSVASVVVIVVVVLIVLWFTVFNRMYYCGKLKVKNENIDMTQIPMFIKDDIMHVLQIDYNHQLVKQSQKMNVSVYGGTLTMTDKDNKKDSVEFDIVNKKTEDGDGMIINFDDVYHNKSLNLIIFVLDSIPTVAIDSSYFHC